MGRKSILSQRPEIQDEIVGYILEGSYIEDAAILAGIWTTTHYRWLKKGEKELEDWDGVTELTLGTYGAYCLAIKRAEADLKRQIIQRVRAIASGAQKGEWTAEMTFGERRFPGHFGRASRQSHDITVTSGPQILPVSSLPAIEGPKGTE